ncbi:MAG TPA: DUF222 domain-containing protein [Jatrophihabitantaceae bacterium]|nr:DUF222 domain-containing protein [Jatrophihabitantaceae bacterium]
MSGDIIEAEPLALLAELDGVLDKLRATDLTALSGPELLDHTRGLERFARRIVTAQHAAVAELDSRRAAADTGHANTAALLTALLRLDPGQARRRVRDAAEFAPRRGLSGEPLPPVLPQTAEALVDGAIGIEHARAISDLFDHIPGRDAETEQDIEAAALQAAAVCGPHELRKWCVQAEARLNQDGTEPREQVQRRLRGLNVIDQPDGSAKLSGRLTPFAAAALRAVLGPLSAPAPAEDGARDERTASQRRHDGLAEACSHLLRSGTLPDSGGAETTILVTIDYRDLLRRYWNTMGATAAGQDSERGHSSAATDTTGNTANTSAAAGYGVTSYGTLIPVDELLRRASDAKIIPVVLNDSGGIMAYGRSRRLASPAQRRALAARDGGCVRPGCTVPADWCEVNHVDRWEHGGTTDIDSLALVCTHNHDDLERGARIVMINGRAHWIEPAWLDPSQTPRLNTAHHLPRIFAGDLGAASEGKQNSDQ